MNIDWSRVTEDDLPSDMRLVAQAAGMDTVRALVETHGGGHVYVPTLRSIRLRQQAQHAKDALERGEPRRSVARALGVSTRQLGSLLRLVE